MQKKVIALAVAALASSAAFAQTNVTVYGVVDVQQAVVKSSSSVTGVNQGNVGRLDSHGNYIGFKGVEDLGNGLKAVFQYETAFSADNGAGLTGGRDSFVGLTGSFGTVVAGNLTHPLRAMGAKVELLPGAAGFGTMASVTGTVLGIKTGADDRASNAVAYVSPSFGGFSATVAYINGESKTQDTSSSSGSGTSSAPWKGTDGSANARQYQIAAQYENGPLFVAAGYHKAKNWGMTGYLPGDGYYSGYTASNQDARVYRLAVAYTLPTNTKLTALWDNTKADLWGDTEVKRNALSVAVAQGFGKNTVGLEYGRAFKTKIEGSSLDDSQASIWTAVYGYELSKRTQLHARYSRLNNGDNNATNFYNLPVNNGVDTTGDNGIGARYTGFSVGVRHSF